jgi:hypothetical protein
MGQLYHQRVFIAFLGKGSILSFIMYYCHQCTYCKRVYCTFDLDKWAAAKRLYSAIKSHLIEYDEDHKEYEMDDGESEDSNQIYHELYEYNEKPAGVYEV